MAKFYRGGRFFINNNTSNLVINDVSGKHTDYDFYFYLENTSKTVSMSVVSFGALSSNQWQVAVKGEGITSGSVRCYWALIHKTNPNAGKPIASTGQFSISGNYNQSKIVKADIPKGYFLARSRVGTSTDGSRLGFYNYSKTSQGVVVYGVGRFSLDVKYAVIWTSYLSAIKLL